GSGNVTIERFESITFRGSNSYTGVTTIPARTTLSLEGPNGAIVGDVAVDGTLNFSRSTDMTYGGVVSGAGSISIDPTSRLTLTGAHIFTGRSYIYGGTLALTGSASLATSGELRFGGNGALDVSGLTAGANHDGHNFALAAGQRLTGSGHVLGDVTVRADSTISPTYSGGAITIDGTVRVEAGGEISMQVFGPGDSDSDRSQLIATGDLVLAGAGGNDYVSIVFENPNDYAGTVPATYTIAVAEDIITTTLATPITATMGGDGAGSAYDPAGLQFLAHGFSPWDRLTLSLVDNELIVDFQPALAGDFDQDGVVNGGDFLAWQRGESPSSTAASDLAVWSAHFGEVDLHGQTAGAAIPEPATVELLLLAAALFAGVFRRARSDRTC
ncbi:MAG: hypothetical protein KDA44_03895, partial [Planctomycetales bacterium]|nr:hypothetical protein [Planctomycetales bacterium]